MSTKRTSKRRRTDWYQWGVKANRKHLPLNRAFEKLTARQFANQKIVDAVAAGWFAASMGQA